MRTSRIVCTVTLGVMCVLGVSTVLAQTAPGPTVPGYFQYSPAQLRAFEERLRPRMNSVKQAAEQLGDFGNHQAWVAHREGDGLAEIHQNWADLMFVISGEATLQIGGELDSPFIESPGEVRAPRATGGTTRVLREGDVANVPAGVPHRFLVREGGQITFFTMKIAKAR